MKYFYILILTLILISCNEKKGYSQDGEVYYCSSEKSVGFEPEEKYKFYNYVPKRFKI